MKYYFYLIILTGLTIFSSCIDNEGPNTPTQNLITNATKDVYKEWGASTAEVQEYMKDYLLTFSENDMLQYTSNNNNKIMITYSFKEDKLDAAALIVEEDIEPSLKEYEYIGDISYTKIYTNNRENTMSTVYKQTYNDLTYVIIGYTPLESELYDDLPNVEFILDSISEVTSNSANVSAKIMGLSKSAKCGIKYCNSLSFDNTTKKIVGEIIEDKLEISLTNLKMGTDYYYYVYVEDNDVIYTSEISSFKTVKLTSGYVNGHKWIDLGLPSGVKWAAYDVGAKQEGEYGDYFAWGELTTRTNLLSPWGDYTWGQYKYSNGSSMYSIGSNISGKSSYDTAKYQWEGDWRMPTLKEMEELLEYCSFEITSDGGVFTGPNGNSILFPFSGQYMSDAHTGTYGCFWTSELSSSYHAHYMYFQHNQEYARIKSNTSTGVPGGERSNGYTIRAIIEI